MPLKTLYCTTTLRLLRHHEVPAPHYPQQARCPQDGLGTVRVQTTREVHSRIDFGMLPPPHQYIANHAAPTKPPTTVAKNQAAGSPAAAYYVVTPVDPSQNRSHQPHNRRGGDPDEQAKTPHPKCSRLSRTGKPPPQRAQARIAPRCFCALNTFSANSVTYVFPVGLKPQLFLMWVTVPGGTSINSVTRDSRRRSSPKTFARTEKSTPKCR